MSENLDRCRRCNGTGKEWCGTGEYTCPNCEGTGKVEGIKTLRVRIAQLEEELASLKENISSTKKAKNDSNSLFPHGHWRSYYKIDVHCPVCGRGEGLESVPIYGEDKSPTRRSWPCGRYEEYDSVADKWRILKPCLGMLGVEENIWRPGE